jgi:ABC-type multidrug transport system fused ATPase/permease subunit
MPSPVTTDSKPPVQTSQTNGPAPAPAASVAPEVSDNLKFQDGVVVDPNSKTQTLADEIPEEIPALATPEDFKKKKKAVSEDSISYFELLLAQSKSNLESRKDSIDARQKSLVRMQEAQKESAKEMDKKIDEQAESQRKSAAKSGFLSIFSKVFTAITAVIGVAMLFVPGMLNVLVNLHALSISLGVVCARFRDVALIMTSVLQLLMFLTPVFWLPDALPSRAHFILYNPLAQLLDVVRLPLLGDIPAPGTWRFLAMFTLLNLTVAAWLYARNRRRIVYWL